MKLVSIVFAVVMTSTMALAHDEDQKRAEAAKEAPALSAALKSAKVSLAEGLQASEKEGTPISAKFETEGGSLQLSVYTMKGGQYSEVVVDPMSGAVVKTEPITSGEDLSAAKEQATAMKDVKQSLRTVVANVEKAHPGYTAVSVTTEIDKGAPEAELALVKGAESKFIETKL